MINPAGNTLRKCRWKDHKWILAEYFNVGLRTFRKYRCEICKRERLRR